MHNKLAGTKEVGRTIRIHNTPLPPDTHIHTQSFTFIHTCSLATYKRTDMHTKPTKTTATWTH